MMLLGGDIDELSRDRFDLIIRRVIFNVGKVRFGPGFFIIMDINLFSTSKVPPKCIASCGLFVVKAILS